MTQAEALTILKTGANVFLTGEPGSGKTHTINEYVSYLRSAGIEPAITASTGIAATHIGGFTIHSWSGIGIRRGLSDYDLDHISQNKNIVKRVENARILIIDETSMLSARTLDMVEVVCREIRRRSEPFGGLQVILVGDFFQLPPINPRTKVEEDNGQDLIFDEMEKNEEFAFHSRAWQALSPLICYLEEQHRQEDEKFLDFLSAVRRANVTEDHMNLLRSRYSPKPIAGTTQLYSHNADVNDINSVELGKLSDESKTFEMQSYGAERLVLALKRGCLWPEKLTLKVGARVMFTKNDIMRHQYVNGTLGTVTGFAKENSYPIVRTNAGKTIFTEPNTWRIEEGGRELARIMQIPLRLAWAITVHKSQGMSLDGAHMDLSDAFEYGQGYVALSRLRSLAGLSLAGLNKRALEVHPEILSKDVVFRESSEIARESFDKILKSEIQKMHDNFISACGGKAGIGTVKKCAHKKESTYAVTKALLAKKLSIKDMAKERKVTVGTIVSHLEKLVEDEGANPEKDFPHLKPKEARFKKIKKAFLAVKKKHSQMLLTPTREILGDDFSFDELRVARLFANL